MANMSYCRFNNTEMDLNDCLDALTEENEYEISQEEVKKGIKMFRNFLEFCACSGIIEDYNEDRIAEIFEEHNEEIRSIS